MQEEQEFMIGKLEEAKELLNTDTKLPDNNGMTVMEQEMYYQEIYNNKVRVKSIDTMLGDLRGGASDGE